MDRSAKRAEVQKLVKDVLDTGRAWTSEERDLVVRHVAAAWMDPNKMAKVDSTIVGIEWEGRILVVGDTVSAEVAHYLKHVVKGGEWPSGTTLEGYHSSAKEIVQDPESGIAVNLYRGRKTITFVRESGKYRGADGYSHIVVEYRVDEDAIRTVFQPEHGLDRLLGLHRKNLTWIRKPKT